MFKIYTSDDGSLVQHWEETYFLGKRGKKSIEFQRPLPQSQAEIYYTVMPLYGKLLLKKEGFNQIRKIDLETGDMFTQRTDNKPWCNIFGFIAALNGYENSPWLSEEIIFIGKTLVMSRPQELLYPNIIKSENFSQWKYKNQQLIIQFP